jgi:TolB-like protein
VALFEQAVGRLAADLATQLSTHGIRSVAFVGFKSLTLHPWSDDFQSVLHDECYQNLILAGRGRFDVVERKDLQPVLDEIDFMKNDEIDPATRVRLNKLVGARAIVVGSLQDDGTQIKVNARILDVERGVNIDAASTRFNRADAPRYPQ